MKIYENITFTGKTYSIMIEQKDDLNEWDIAESFKEQYPNKICMVSFSRIVKVEVGMIIIGLNLK